MAAQIPNSEPSRLIAGDTARWQIDLPDYPASAGWSLVYTLVNATNRITFNSAARDTQHLVQVDAVTTAAWAPGSYDWRRQCRHDEDVHTTAAGSMVIESAFSVATDGRSHARKALENIEAYMENANNIAASQYEIAGRRIWRHTFAELLTLRDRYRYEVAQEQAAARVARGLPDKRRVYVRFGL